MWGIPPIPYPSDGFWQNCAWGALPMMRGGGAHCWFGRHPPTGDNLSNACCWSGPSKNVPKNDYCITTIPCHSDGFQQNRAWGASPMMHGGGVHCWFGGHPPTGEELSNACSWSSPSKTLVNKWLSYPPLFLAPAMDFDKTMHGGHCPWCVEGARIVGLGATMPQQTMAAIGDRHHQKHQQNVDLWCSPLLLPSSLESDKITHSAHCPWCEEGARSIGFGAIAP